MTLPRDILTGKLPAVYNTILSLGGVLIPMHTDLAGNVLAYCPDGSTLTATPGVGVDFDHNGQIPRVAGGSPTATFNAVTGGIKAPAPVGSSLNLSNGGTILVLIANPLMTGSAALVHKSHDVSYGGYDGYIVFFRSTGQVVLRTSSSASTTSELATDVGVLTPGGCFLVALKVDPVGNAQIHVEPGGLVASRAGMEIPSNVAGDLSLGAALSGGLSAKSSFGFAAVFDGKSLDVLTIQTIAAQCGPLG
jgi:hypothetical protein